MQKTIMVAGAAGQIGTELVAALRKVHGNDNVIATDIKDTSNESLKSGPFELMDVLDKEAFLNIIKKYNCTEVYLLAALLSATAEQKPMAGWNLNMNGLFNGLELAKEKHIDKLFWPSSIAVFGPDTPKENTPQRTVMEPRTVYGITKVAGESWCEYYHRNYDVDVRSIRYPGLIGYTSLPGGGTTDYAVDIFHQALKEGKYECFLSENRGLPMMYMPDAIEATLNLMSADANDVKVRSSYNISGISFTPKEIAEKIKAHIPEFEISFNPDFRDKIAATWPESIDDNSAKKDWGWKPNYDLDLMVEDMLKNLKGK